MTLNGKYIPNTNFKLSGNIYAEFGIATTPGISLSEFRTSGWNANYIDSNVTTGTTTATYKPFITSGPISMGFFKNTARLTYITCNISSQAYYPFGDRPLETQIGQPGNNGPSWVPSYWPPAATETLVGWASRSTLYGYTNYGFGYNYTTNTYTNTDMGSVYPVNFNNRYVIQQMAFRQILWNQYAQQLLVRVSLTSAVSSSPWFGIVYYPTVPGTYTSIPSVAGYYQETVTTPPDRTWTQIYSLASFPTSGTATIGIIQSAIVN